MPYASGLRLLWLAIPTLLRLLVNIPRFLLHRYVWSLLLPPAPFTAEYLSSPSRLTSILKAANVIPSDEGKQRVISYRFSKMAAGGIGDVRRLHVEYAYGYDKKVLPASFVVKELGSVIKDIVVGSLVDLVAAEHRGYTILSKLVGDLQPKCYYFGRSSFGSGVLLLEDLGHLTHKTSVSGGTIADITSILHTEARLHSRTWCEGEKYNSTFLMLSEFIDNLAPQNFASCISGPWNKLILSKPHVLRAMHALSTYECQCVVYRKTRGWGLDEPYRGQFVRPFGAVCHNDMRLDNVFFTPDGVALAVDWQVCMYRHPLQEICWTLMDLEPALLGFDVKRPDDTSRFQPIIDALLLEYLTTLHDELRRQGKHVSFPTMTLADAKKDFPLYCIVITKLLIVAFSTVIKDSPPSDGDLSRCPLIVQTMAAYLHRLDWILKCTVNEEFYASIQAPPPFQPSSTTTS